MIRSTGGFLDVDTAEGIVRARLRGRLKKEKLRTDLCVAGDEVALIVDDASAVVDEVLPRRTRISRVQPARGGPPREDVLVANVDQLLVCVAYGDPPLHPRFIDRFLVIAEHNDVEAMVVVNKVDRPEADVQRELVLPFRSLGYELIETSTVTGVGVDALRARLAGRITAICGPSGAGKSSLCNAVEPGLGTLVGQTSEAHGKGRHTTRVATLHALSSGGYLADTPGIRELAAYGIPPETLDRCFVEFRPLLGQCAYRSCRHISEPSCAILEAVEAGQVSEERYDSYLRLLLGDERPERAKG
ncbi:MAG: ribosome small subunit-dependent GTPase A [Polyangiaceae bacterium]|nr:ribosome small subunit-dependent GTPase A [Polyangiaceae bacterium]